MKVHQILWHLGEPNILRLNSLSCFDCIGRDCVHGFHFKQICYGSQDEEMGKMHIILFTMICHKLKMIFSIQRILGFFFR